MSDGTWPRADSISGTEDDPRLDGWWELLQRKQLTAEELQPLADELLIYIAGHRYYRAPQRDRLEGEDEHTAQAHNRGNQPGRQAKLEDERSGREQKVRGNAVRAADELARRQAERRHQELLDVHRHQLEVDKAALNAQMQALDASTRAVAESNTHQATTATATQGLTKGTWAVAAATAFAVCVASISTWIAATKESTVVVNVPAPVVFAPADVGPTTTGPAGLPDANRPQPEGESRTPGTIVGGQVP